MQNSTISSQYVTFSRIAAVVIGLLALGDVISTYLLYEQGELQEANPLFAWLFDAIGFWPSALLKLALTSLLIWAVLRWPQYWWFPVALIFPLAFTVINNLM